MEREPCDLNLFDTISYFLFNVIEENSHISTDLQCLKLYIYEYSLNNYRHIVNRNRLFIKKFSRKL